MHSFHCILIESSYSTVTAILTLMESFSLLALPLQDSAYKFITNLQFFKRIYHMRQNILEEKLSGVLAIHFPV